MSGDSASAKMWVGERATSPLLPFFFINDILP